MKTKLRFLFVLLTMLWWGVNFAWGKTYVISAGSGGTLTGTTSVLDGANHNYTASFSNGLSIAYSRNQSGKDLSALSSTDYIKYSNGVEYTLTGIPESEVITSITAEGIVNGSGTSQFYINGVNKNNDFTSSVSEKYFSFSESPLIGNVTFKAQGAETGIKFTITTEDRTIDNIYSGSYPYTWDFTVEAAKWAKSISQMESSSYWYVKDGGGEARCKETWAPADNGIDIIKGLAFDGLTAATANSGSDYSKGTLCLDWTNRLLWMNGTITIPGLSVGQTITFDSNADVTGDANVGSTSGKVFSVSTAGDATFTVNTYVRSISVAAVVVPDIVSLSVNDDDIFLRTGPDANPSVRLTSSTFSRSTTGKYMRIKTNLGANLSSSFMTTDYFTVTSSDASIIDVASYGVTQAGQDNRLYYYGLEVKGTGTVTLTFTYNGTTSCSKTFRVVECPTFSSYPYTWDFGNNDWVSSAFQALESKDGDGKALWKTVVENNTTKGANLDGFWIPSNNDIDWIKGLEFGGAIYLDYEHKAVRITGSGTGGSGNLKIPNLKAGYRIMLSTDYGSFTVPETTNVSESGGVYTVTEDGNASFQINGYISSVKVEKIATVLSNRYSNRETFDFNGSENTAINHMIGVNVTSGINADDIQVTIEPSDLLTLDVTNKKITGEGYLSLWLTGQREGTGTVTVYYPGDDSHEAAGPLVYNVRVIRSQQPKVWNFMDSSYWSDNSTSASTFSGDGNWTANDPDFTLNTQITDAQLTANSSTIGATQGLYITAKSNSVHLNVGNYMSLETSNASSIRIPSLVAGQHVVFRVAPVDGECGIMATSGNMRLINGQVSNLNSYYTFHVERDGDGVFTRTNNAVNLQIEFIEVIGKTNNCNEMKLVYDNGTTDISNTMIKVSAGASSVPIKVTTNSTGTITTTTSDANGIISSIDGNNITLNTANRGTAAIVYTQSGVEGYQHAYAAVYLNVKTPVTVTLSDAGPFTTMYGTDFTTKQGTNSTVVGKATLSNGDTYAGAVRYKSSNERIAKVSSTGKVTCYGVGTAIITAYTEETDDYLAGEASYTVTFTSNSAIEFSFVPHSGYLNLNKNITPLLRYPNSTFTGGVTFEVSPDGVVSIGSVTNPKDSKTRVKITANKGASSVGKSAIVTAIGSITGQEAKYYTTFEVNVTSETDCNFEWDGPSEYTIFTGDFMYIPGIIGNSNGNSQYSLGSYNEETAHSYVYHIQNGTIDWWKDSDGEKYYKYNEGCPNYQIVGNTGDTSTDKAYLFWVKGNGENADTLVIYGNKPGDAKLRATDPQNGTSCADITIHVRDKSSVVTENDTYISGMSFPYTWDFTTNFDTSMLDNNELYWKKNGNGNYTMGEALSFNYDYADEDNNGVTNGNQQVNYKIFSNGNSLVPQLYGMSISLGNSTQDVWQSKVDRLRITRYSAGSPRLSIIGGAHKLTLPTAPIRPDAYKLFIKARGNGNQARIIFNGGSANSIDVRYLESGKDKDGNSVTAGEVHTYTTKDYEQKSSENSENYMKDIIIGYPVTSGEDITLQLNNVDIYWIAFSTEAKDVYMPSSTTYPAATYSYDEDLDFNYTDEIYDQAFTPYYASDFTSSSNQVVLSRPEGGITKAKTGLLLKGLDGTSAKSYYMVAKARNVDTYETPEALTGNMLKPTIAGSSITRFVESGGTITHSNFVLTNYYRKVDEDFNTIGNDNYADWSFVRVDDSFTGSNIPGNAAYLQVPNRVGQVVAGQTGTPGSRVILGIVFDDDTDATGIQQIEQETNVLKKEGWYTMQGMRVSTPAKGGIYIHNGKKVAIK